jgi:GNAT superfamily N-acetyltransferase
MASVTVAPVTAERLDDLATLFGTNGTTRGCYCTWFLIPAKECHAGWSGGNRLTFEACAREETLPMGLLAYADGAPVGWCAAGPRSRYSRALRSPVLRQHDPAEDDQVWLVPCFFVRVGFRRQGIMRELLTRAVDLAAGNGATAIEGFPLSGEKRRSSGEAFLGVESLFAACGFTVVDRPTANRAVMRRDLGTRRRRITRRRSDRGTGAPMG